MYFLWRPVNYSLAHFGDTRYRVWKAKYRRYDTRNDTVVVRMRHAPEQVNRCTVGTAYVLNGPSYPPISQVFVADTAGHSGDSHTH